MSLDHAEKINYLMLIIHSICEENNLKKSVIVDDFIDLMKQKERDIELTIQMQKMTFWDE